eukprot:gnl/TRDRNA2_/TRDRNA2_167203_c0_seq1.p1 gnl/TRDRNA2_/TRDRNA2_167203_c0~~gnl/TRDRNA2_/TRDRNA2_167203_c0_seq1.p1  ORF type:complete len:257 (-),score=50.61 gnl/TRDRNA2_/TRDRNA2_167203_c0_seq1:94-813(-)
MLRAAANIFLGLSIWVLLCSGSAEEDPLNMTYVWEDEGLHCDVCLIVMQHLAGVWMHAERVKGRNKVPYVFPQLCNDIFYGDYDAKDFDDYIRFSGPGTWASTMPAESIGDEIWRQRLQEACRQMTGNPGVKSQQFEKDTYHRFTYFVPELKKLQKEQYMGPEAKRFEFWYKRQGEDVKDFLHEMCTEFEDDELYISKKPTSWFYNCPEDSMYFEHSEFMKLAYFRAEHFDNPGVHSEL